MTGNTYNLRRQYHIITCYFPRTKSNNNFLIPQAIFIDEYRCCNISIWLFLVVHSVASSPFSLRSKTLRSSRAPRRRRRHAHLSKDAVGVRVDECCILISTRQVNALVEAPDWIQPCTRVSIRPALDGIFFSLFTYTSGLDSCQLRGSSHVRDFLRRNCSLMELGFCFSRWRRRGNPRPT